MEYEASRGISNPKLYTYYIDSVSRKYRNEKRNIASGSQGGKGGPPECPKRSTCSCADYTGIYKS